MPAPALVSIIIPTWNRQGELPAAIASALGQSYPHVEVLVCDDGSSDDSRALVAQLGDPRVRWIEGAHAGLPSVPRNRGLQAASGEWIAFMDSDDSWLPHKLEHQLARLGASGGTIRASCANAWRRIDAATPDTLLLDAPASDTEFDLRQMFKTNAVITSTVLLHRSLLAAIGGFPTTRALKVGEDYAYWLRVASLTPLAFHHEPLAVYADAPSTSVRASVRNESLVKLRIYRDYFGWLAKLQPARLPGTLLLALVLEAHGAAMRRWWRLRGCLGQLRRRLTGSGR